MLNNDRLRLFLKKLFLKWKKQDYFVLAFCILLALLPNESNFQRAKYPQDIKSQLGLLDHIPINITENRTFNLVIKPDTASLGKDLSFDEIRAIDQKQWSNDHAQEMSVHPYRYPKKISAFIGTYGRRNQCKISLLLDDQIESNQVACEDILNNHLTDFEFADPLLPGIYQAKINHNNSDSDNSVAIYAHQLKTAPDEMWILPHDGKGRHNFVQLMSLFFKHSPALSLGYLLCVFVIFCLFKLNMTPSLKIASLFFVFLCANNLITKPLSGFDETAHLTMMHQTFSANGDISDDFKRAAKELMFKNEFYRLHNATPQDDGECPHKILETCGVSEKPTNLYGAYKSIVEVFAEPGDLSPTQLLWLGRFINAIWISSLIIVSYVIMSRGLFTAFVMALLLIGGFHSQVASITNDISMYILGFLGALAFTSLTEGRWNKGLCAAGLYLLSFALLKSFDRSSAAAIVTLASMPFFLLSPFFTVPAARENSKTKGYLLGLLIVGTAFLSFYGIFMLVKGGFLDQFKSHFALLSDDSGLLYNLKKIPDLSGVRHGLWEYLRSLVGSYVWGHDFFPSYIYYIFLATYIGLAFPSGIYLAQNHKRSGAILLSLAMGLGIGGYLIIALAIASHAFGRIDFFTFLALRMSVPGISLLMALIALGIAQLLKSKLANGVQALCFLWVFTLLLYFYPRFYIGDLY